METPKDKIHTHRFSTRLTDEELKQYSLIRQYVVGFCGEVSEAEVLRYLIRNWSETDHG